MKPLVVLLVLLCGVQLIRAQPSERTSGGPSLNSIDIRLTQEALRRHAGVKLRIVSNGTDTATLQLLDAVGLQVPGFTQHDFVVESPARGKAEIVGCDPISIEHHSALHISFVLDNSASMFHAYDSVTRYLDSMLKGLNATYSAVVFDDRPRSASSISTGRGDLFITSKDADTSCSAIESFWHTYDAIRTDFTPLYDAIHEGLDPEVSPRVSSSTAEQVVIVVSDGADNASRWSLEDVASLGRNLQVRLFAINFRTEPDTRLQWLAHRLHGEYYYAADLSGLREALRTIRTGILHGYRLRYWFPPPGAQGVR